jgi:hypothetical protein
LALYVMDFTAGSALTKPPLLSVNWNLTGVCPTGFADVDGDRVANGRQEADKAVVDRIGH